MSDQLQTLQQDISFLKALALEGRSPAMLGGSTLVAAGSVYGVVSIGDWAILQGYVPVASPWAIPSLWIGATVIFIALTAFISRRLRERKPVTSPATRAAARAWQGVGWAIFTLWACMAIVAWRVHSDIPLLLFPSIILALYGTAWTVALEVLQVGWVRLAAMGSYAAAILSALFCTSPTVFLVFAAALILLVIAPGAAMIRRARAAG